MTGSDDHSPEKHARRLRSRWVLVIAAVVLVGVGAGAVAFHGGDDESGSGRHAVINTVRNDPGVNVFFGTSCAGVHGAWFLNVVQGGSDAQPHAAYYLRWSFTPTQEVAKPGGRITVSGGQGPAPSLTLADGVVTLKGARQDGTPVEGTGEIEVRLTKSDGDPTLTIIQKGLEDAARATGLVLPFPFDGQPLTVPITLQKEASGC